MRTFRTFGTYAVILSFAGAMAFACSGKDETDGGDGDGDTSRPVDGATGAVCEVPEDCFPDVAEGELLGEAICLDRVDEGYCTHECVEDADCCGAEGECEEDVNQVCAPFESTGTMMCFLSCEEEDIDAAQDWEEPPADESEYCQQGAGYDFICRSSGGGSENRKICVPGDCGVGEDCSEDAHCDTDLTCVTDYAGGYCALAGCQADLDCPDGSVCVDDGGAEPICMVTCAAESDCSFCRADSVHGTCTADVATVDDATVSVCIPERN
jgi:hypothetical protein